MIVLNKDETIAYIASGPRGLLILDISDVNNIKFLSQTPLDLYSAEGLDISIKEEMVIVALRFYGFYFLDIRDKTKPVIIYKYVTFGSEAVKFVKNDKTILLIDRENGIKIVKSEPFFKLLSDPT